MSELNKIKEQVEQRLQEQQASKTFKDIGRVAQTKKERSAYKLITSKILTDLEDDAVMAYNMTKKENVWSEIDVKAEKDRGVTSGAAYLKVKLREAVPTRPKDEKATRKSYVLFLEDLQARLFNCYNVEQISALATYYRNLDLTNTIGLFIEPEYLTASPERKSEIETVLKRNSNIRIAFLYGGSTLVKKIINEIFSSRFENTLFNASDAANQIWNDAKEKEPITEEESKILIEKINQREKAFIEANELKLNEYKNYTDQQLREHFSEWRGIPADWKKDIDAFRKFAVDYYERRISKEQGIYKIRREAAKPRNNDWSWFEKPETKQAQTKKDEERETINTKPPLSYIKRTGGYKIEQITPAQIIDTFGFSAVNYGVYVDDKWSKEHTKHFLEAICDMAEMLNIDIKKANELGKLSVAFGAKGRKGQAAAYFPQTKDINLTKGNGDGSVAHEWGHYFDNVIVEQDIRRATNNFATEGAVQDSELRMLFKELTDFIYKGNPEYTPLLPCRFYAKKPTAEVKNLVWNGYSWTQKPIEIKATIDETIQQVIAENNRIGSMDENFYSSQLRIFGYIIDAFGLEEYNIPLRLKTSYLYHKTAYKRFAYCFKETDTKIVTAVVQRTKYWTSIVELFARSWETVILKKLMDKNRVSNYLVDSIPTEDIIAEGYNAPYPTGKELEYIENIIDRIIVAFKKKFMIGSFIPPSNIRADVYLDFKGEESGLTGDGMVIEKDKKGKKEVLFVEQGKVIEDVKTSTNGNVEDLSRDVESISKALEGKENAKPIRFEVGKKLNEKEKKEVLKSLQDSYKEKKRPYTIQDINDRERKVYIENMYDYMFVSDITGKKIRWAIILPDGRIAHPTEVYGDISMSEIERHEKNIDYADESNELNYKKGLKEIKDIQKVAGILAKNIAEGYIKIKTLKNDYGEIIDVRIVPNKDNPKFSNSVFDYVNNIADEIIIDPKIPQGFDVERLISEAYHKAKEDGNNPELVKAVEDLLDKTPQQSKETTPNVEENLSTKSSDINDKKLIDVDRNVDTEEELEEEFSQQELEDTIASLEILVEMGDEEARDSVEALKLLIKK